MTTFPFSILTPSGTIVSGDVTQVEVSTYMGSLGVMAKHEPMVAVCPAGIVRIEQDNVWVRFKSEDFILTTDGEKTTVLTSHAQFAGKK